ncbi:MAG TPA: iron ABC transporter substrate-binding protein, partial [Dermatophilaceae bacterium]|nr:iron ABC transporter substrate-binding protein [Dermatophilaceae bacterium]
MRFTGRAVSEVGVAAGLVAVLLGVTACGGATGAAGADQGSGEKATLTLYNAQHEDLMTLMVADFTKATGIKVNMRNGEDFELGNQIVQEDKASPADVFVTENSPARTL